MFSFFASNSRYPVLGTAYKIIQSFNISLLTYGAAIEPETFKRLQYLSLALVFASSWEHIDTVADGLGDVLNNIANTIRHDFF